MTFLKSNELRILNLISLLIYFIIFVSIFSTIATIVDDSFARWTFKDITKDMSRSFDGLPWSLWFIVISISDFVEEIVSEFVNFGHYILPFTIPPTLISYYCAYRGKKNGIQTEREVWRQWYENDKTQVDTNMLPTLSGSTSIISHIRRIYNPIRKILRRPMLIAHHFIYHQIAFTTLVIIRSIISSFSFELSNLLVISILSTICTAVSSYIEGTGLINGVRTERLVWTKWYHRLIEVKNENLPFSEPPPAID